MRDVARSGNGLLEKAGRWICRRHTEAVVESSRAGIPIENTRPAGCAGRAIEKRRARREPRSTANGKKRWTPSGGPGARACVPPRSGKGRETQTSPCWLSPKRPRERKRCSLRGMRRTLNETGRRGSHGEPRTENGEEEPTRPGAPRTPSASDGRIGRGRAPISK